MTTSSQPSFSVRFLPLSHFTPANTSQLPLSTSTPSAYPFPTLDPISPGTLDTTYTPFPDEDEDDDLPYPAPLPRSAFLDPTFDAPTYLATLRNRHQTLEDLRSELRERVKGLSAELVDVVNAEYEALMGVGLGLRGGEEKVGGVRVGLLGFRRDVGAVRDAVGERRREVGALIQERKRVRGEVVLGRRLLDVEERIGELEVRLGVVEGEVDDDDDEDEDGEERLEATARLYAQMTGAVAAVGEHPFVETLRGRMAAVREALLADLGTAMRDARRRKNDQAVLDVVTCYREIGEAAEAVKVLKAK